MSTAPAIHSVHIYEDSAALVNRLCAIVSASLRTGDSVVIVATAEHREQLLKELQNCGLDVRTHARQGRYAMLDAEQTLASFMREGMPDTNLFNGSVLQILDQARRSARSHGKRLTVFGEMVAVLWQEGKKDAALQLETLWNDALNEQAFHLHCAYPRGCVLNDEDEVAIHGVHSHWVQ